MKKSNLLWLFSLAMVLMMNLTLASCGSDDEEAAPDTPAYDVSKLFGTWESKNLDLTGIDDQMTQMLDGAKFVFNENYEGKVSISNQNIPLDLPYKWEVKGDVLHITIMAMSFDFKVKEFSDNEIHFEGTMTRAGEEIPLNVVISKVASK